MPHVRRNANWNARMYRDEILPMLDKMLKDGTNYDKILACGFHGYPQDKKLGLSYLDAYGAILRDTKEDPWARVAAAGALAYMNDSKSKSYPSEKYYMDAVKMITEERPLDRFGDVDWAIGGSVAKMCDDAFAAGLVGDIEIFYKAAIKLLNHKHQHPRGDGAKMLRGMPLEDFHRVADKVIHVIEDKDRTYHSYHSPGGPVGGWVSILANLNIEEGITYALGILNIKSGKGSFKLRAVMDALAAYGGNAKETVEQLKKEDKWKKVPTNRKLKGNWNRMIKAIETDKSPKKMITFKEAKSAGRK